MTEKLYQTDAYLSRFDANVAASRLHAGKAAVVGSDVVVAVPGLSGAVPDLDEADAAFEQPAGDHHLPGL